ncbi:MAG: hypothetical protein ACE14M_04030 [Terriglobales bacterium]
MQILLVAMFVLAQMVLPLGQAFAGADPAMVVVPNLSGIWKLDRDLTNADLRRFKTSTLVVTQTYDEVRFDRYDGKNLYASDTFLTDGKERPRYTTRIERAYSRARWDKKNPQLVITTRSFLDLDGYQAYDDIDIWQVSADGETLTNKQRDGKVIVFYRDHSESHPYH